MGGLRGINKGVGVIIYRYEIVFFIGIFMN